MGLAKRTSARRTGRTRKKQKGSDLEIVILSEKLREVTRAVHVQSHLEFSISRSDPFFE